MGIFLEKAFITWLARDENDQSLIWIKSDFYLNKNHLGKLDDCLGIRSLNFQFFWYI
ncbi:hypothetical protein [Streptococcus thoraltensis]|uniref:hypothetical protein n=1 Tax=Streptococcus thoraltensis TaxID=55085 RepID=UPI001F58BD4A|nr:hypothetical protein [Streptococcus thoraltensis]